MKIVRTTVDFFLHHSNSFCCTRSVVNWPRVGIACKLYLFLLLRNLDLLFSFSFFFVFSFPRGKARDRTEQSLQSVVATKAKAELLTTTTNRRRQDIRFIDLDKVVFNLSCVINTSYTYHSRSSSFCSG